MNIKIQVLASPSSIMTFNHEQFGAIRICQSEGKEWFCLSDVCKALDLSTPAKVKQRLSEGGMNTIHTPVTNQYGVTYNQSMTYLVWTERGKEFIHGLFNKMVA